LIIYKIYKATNKINGKHYIGKTNDFVKRIRNHKNNMKTQNTIFYSAIREYGWNNFSWEIICETLNENYSYELESFFIEEFKTCVFDENNNGYNMTRGGKGITSEYAKENIKNLKETKEYWEQRKLVGQKMSSKKDHPFFGGKIQKEKVQNGTHHFLDIDFHKKNQQKRVKDKTHNLLNMVSCYDKFGNFIQISKEKYNSQSGPKKDWEWVANTSNEGKKRKEINLNSI
jgi:group I intron endonuclease